MAGSLRWDATSCRAYGMCAQEFPEGIALDEWGYPIVDGRPIPEELVRRAKAAAHACPVLALRMQSAS